MKFENIHSWNYCIINNSEIEGDFIKNTNIQIEYTNIYNTPYIVINNQSYLLIIKE